jgi:hypothetical protein
MMMRCVMIVSDKVLTYLLEPSVAETCIEHIIILDFMAEEV